MKNAKQQSNLSFYGQRGTQYLVISLMVLLLFTVAGCTASNEAASDDEAQTYVSLSREALATHLAIDENEIELEAITEPAVEADNYIITLMAMGQVYEYHGRNNEVLLVSEPLPPAPVPDTAVYTEADLVRQLEAAQANVALNTEPIPAADIFTVPGHIINVNNGQLQLYVYDNATAAQADAVRVSADGYEIAPLPEDSAQETAVMDWTESPHFYRWENLIILYVGEDEEIVTLLNEVLGEPFAG